VGDELLHGKEQVVYADACYTGADKRVARKNLQWQIAARPSRIRAMSEGQDKSAAQQAEHAKARIRAFVEHPFRVIKRQFGYTKVRFKGLAKNTAQVVTLFALSNLWMVRKKLIAMADDLRPLIATTR
jgi:IS5 family transposase